MTFWWEAPFYVHAALEIHRKTSSKLECLFNIALQAKLRLSLRLNLILSFSGLCL